MLGNLDQTCDVLFLGERFVTPKPNWVPSRILKRLVAEQVSGMST